MISDQAVLPARTVCHGCRGAGLASVPNKIGVMVSRPVLIPGDGDVLCSVATQFGLDTTVTRPCSICGSADEPGWQPGFVIPL